MPSNPMTADAFLELIARTFPPSWLEGLQNPGPGYELVECYAAIAERLDLAAERVRQSLYAYLAPSSAFATVTLSLTRTTTAAEVTVKLGSSFKDRYGRQYLLTEDVTFAIGDDGPHQVVARAAAPGYQFNQLGPYTTAGGEAVEGGINTRSYLMLDPVFGDTSIVAEQVNDATGGVTGLLDLHAEDRGMPRLPGESDDQLRARIRRLPDTTTPAAINRFLQSVFGPLGQQFWVFEPFEQGVAGVTDASTQDVGDYETNLMAYDDERVPGGSPTPPGNGVFWGRMWDTREARGAFVVVVPKLPAMRHCGFLLGDAVTSLNALANPNGERGLSVLGLYPGVSADITPTVLSGRDELVASVYRAVVAGLRRISPAGVFPLVELYEGT